MGSLHFSLLTQASTTTWMWKTKWEREGENEKGRAKMEGWWEATTLKGRQEKNEKEHKTEKVTDSQIQSEVPRHGATLPSVDESLELQRGAASSNVYYSRLVLHLTSEARHQSPSCNLGASKQASEWHLTRNKCIVLYDIQVIISEL